MGAIAAGDFQAWSELNDALIHRPHCDTCTCEADDPGRGPVRGVEGICTRCNTRIVWTGYAWEHCTSGTSGTLSCPIDPS